MKLDIQRFSGGSFDYMYETLERYYAGKMRDIEMNDLIVDLVKVLHDLEWLESGDTDESDYEKSLKEFKDKWFKGNRTERFESYLDNELKRVSENIRKSFGE